MKNKTLLISAAILLLVFLTFGTFFWYNYFISMTSTIENKTVVEKTSKNYKTGNIIFKDDGNRVNETNAKSISGEDLTSVPSYNFQITNDGKTEDDYTLIIEDLPANLVNDGCTEDMLLKRSELKYQLILNGKVIKEDFMDKINDNILDTRKIDSKKTNSYSLKIYIHDGAVDWFAKHYHYKVVLKSKEVSK